MIKDKSLYFSVEVFGTGVPIMNTETSKQILQIKQKRFKNLNWWEADQWAIYRGCRS